MGHVIVPGEQLAMAHAVHGHITNVPGSHLAIVSHPGGVTAVVTTAANATSGQHLP